MSDLGQQAYKPYWNSVVSNLLLQQSMVGGGTANRLSIMDISKKTSIMAEDIIFTLNQLGLLKVINGAYFIAAYESNLKELVKTQSRSPRWTRTSYIGHRFNRM